MPKIIGPDWPGDAAVEAAAKTDYESTYRGDRWEDADPYLQQRHRREVAPLLQAAIATAPDAEDEWQPIETARPKAGQAVLLAYDNGDVVEGAYVDMSRTLHPWSSGFRPRSLYVWKPGSKITHVRPLPAPPAIKRAEGK